REIITMIQRVIWLLAMVVLLGSLMIWIMMPTNTYAHIWLPNIRNKVNQSTYFGTQGANLLIYTFPVLFVAVLGSLYLHLEKKANDDKLRNMGKQHRYALWKRPMLIKGPLGIVSVTELAFLIMFMALLIWSFAVYLHNGFSLITPKSVANSGQKLWQAKLMSAAFRLGLVGNICLAFLFFPVARGSSLLPLFGLTSEGSIKYHIWLGHMAITLTTAHGLCYIIYWAVTNDISQMVKWGKTDVSHVAGELATVAGLGLWATTFPGIRRRMFELFFYTHHLYTLFVFFFVMHVGSTYSCMMLPGFYLFLVDRYLRFLQSRRRVRLVSARILPCQTLELNFSKTPGLSYNPTSITFINVPSLSKLQWHPFTVTSNSNLEPDKFSVVIKSEGSWSTKLFQMLSSPTSMDRLEVSLEGPYGPASTNFLRHDTLVMVCGGSGITPFVSIIRESMFASATLKCKTPQIILICSFKKSSDLAILDLIHPISGIQSEMLNLQLQIKAYVTREKIPTTDAIANSKNVRAIWFKPLATDEPMSAILGPNSWLWLAAIIVSSFIVFLILIGIITRYYIYPIDHNSNAVFPYSTRAILNILVIFVSIATIASAAVFWNKKQNGKEANQVQNMEGTTPAASPSSLYYNADRELESLPNQSLIQVTDVHYGERPDLKKLLFDCKGSSSVGVLVAGPKKMRHDVAKICSSGWAGNMHFESISFCW
ncbi:Ferric_reduct domain-containing protein/FAD_binding_8 domain-containing protein/NAD_binding_6 domain-containing protein, partial [Cephalotus follicularis]